MKVSTERLSVISEGTGFRLDMLEKMLILVSLLQSLFEDSYLRGRLALKGGTAINLFMRDLPRLSVDADLNYIGSCDVRIMKEERPRLEKVIVAICEREGLSVRRVPTEHAGGKWRLSYGSALGQTGNLELDINYTMRIPLWPVRLMDSSHLADFVANKIPVLDGIELAAGKLAALFARNASRDLYDAHFLLTEAGLDFSKLRLAFTVYGGINRRDWREISTQDIKYDLKEIEGSLLPTLRQEHFSHIDNKSTWAENMLEECKEALKRLLPLEQNELEFISLLNEKGEIHSELLTYDEQLRELIDIQPGLQWKAQNVRDYKGLDA